MNRNDVDTEGLDRRYGVGLAQSINDEICKADKGSVVHFSPASISGDKRENGNMFSAKNSGEL